MQPSVVLDLKRSAVREAASRFRMANPRIFSSVLHGTDLDLLVDALPGATLFDLGGLHVELETLLGIHVSRRLVAEIPRPAACRGAAGMNENRLPDYLDHMQQAATDACAFVEGLGKADFLEDKGGRKPKMTDSKIESAKKLLTSGVPPEDVARNLGVSIPILYRWVPASAHA